MSNETFANNANTTLNGGINNSTTTLTVASSTGFPSATSPNQFRIIIDSEIMIVTAISGTTWTVTRGAESTTAVSHSSGAPVAHIVTAGALGAFTQGSGGGSTRGAYASRPAAGNAGNTYYATDAPYVSEDNGTSWQNFGPIWALTPPVDANYSWVLQQTGVASNTTNGCLTLTCTPGGGTWGIKTQAVPGSTPWTISIMMLATLYPTNGSAGAGLCLYDNVGHGMIGFYWICYSGSNGSRLKADKYTGANSSPSYNGSYSNDFNSYFSPSPINWMQINNDGTHLNYNYSADGYNWTTMLQTSNTDYITPTDIGLVLVGGNSFSVAATYLHWKQT